MSAPANKIIAGLEQAVAHSKGPQFTTELEMRVSSLPSANNSFHLYLADKRCRKVAALWGGTNEKMANGYLWSAAPELYEALLLVRSKLIEALARSGGREDECALLQAIDPPLAKARGEQ